MAIFERFCCIDLRVSSLVINIQYIVIFVLNYSIIDINILYCTYKKLTKAREYTKAGSTGHTLLMEEKQSTFVGLVVL